MTKKTHLSGLDEVLQNMNKQVEQIEGVTLKGLYRASIPIRKTAQDLCPVVTGNLKASAYTVTSRGNVQAGKSPTFKGDNASEMSSHHSSSVDERQYAVGDDKNPTVEVGFTAVYAASVHENPNAGQTPESEAYTKTGKQIASTKPKGQWKFLEEALKRNENDILDVIQREAKKSL